MIYHFHRNMLGILLSWIIGTTVMKPLDYGFDYGLVEESTTEQIEQPLYEWRASWYDYKLWWQWWSKWHDTCAIRDKEHRYQTFKVCNDEWVCVDCYLNDYWPAREDRVIDLSSHAFRQLAPLSKGLVYVKVYLEDV